MNRWFVDYVYDISYSQSRNTLFCINPYDMKVEERSVATGEVIKSFPCEKNPYTLLVIPVQPTLLFASDCDGKDCRLDPEKRKGNSAISECDSLLVFCCGMKGWAWW